jgi:two-component system LytT family response regulator
MTIRAIIVDDEPLLRRSILRLLKTHPNVDVVAECGDGPSAVQCIQRLTPDVVFLDVEMPGYNGFDVLSRVQKETMPATIFVTAYSQYAVKAFEARALDYLLKPFGQQRFDEALHRVLQRISPAQEIAPESCSEPTTYLDRLPIHHRGRTSFVTLSNVDWIEAEKNHALLHVGERVAVVRRTLSSLEKELDPKQFVRIHRSTIVNRAKVREILPWANGHHSIVLDTGQQLRMSRYQQSARTLLSKG